MTGANLPTTVTMGVDGVKNPSMNGSITAAAGPEPVQVTEISTRVQMEPVPGRRTSFLKSFGMKSDTIDKISIFLAELLGTGLLVFLGCMGCIGSLGVAATHLNICLTFGLVVMICVQIFGCVSGCHINPAVTVAAVVYEHITPMMGIVYFVAQILGGFMGFGVLKAVTPAHVFERPENSTAVGLCTTTPGATITPLNAVMVEFLITMVLILVCCGVWDPRNAKHHDSVPVRFGLAIAALALVGGPYTGASMNPARSLAPAIWNGDFTHHWVYWVGPLSAGFLTAYAYKAVFRREAPPEKDAHHALPLKSSDDY